MDTLKKALGLLWILMGPLTIGFLFYVAFKNINSGAKSDISNPIPWIIIIVIFTPIAIGLSIFGWYSWKGEYSRTQQLPDGLNT